VSARKVREWAPKPGDPGTVLREMRHGVPDEPSEELGTVWSAGPRTGTRWCVRDDGSAVIAKVTQRKKTAFQLGGLDVRAVDRFDASWQRRTVALLDVIARTPTVWLSHHVEPDPDLTSGERHYELLHADQHCPTRKLDPRGFAVQQYGKPGDRGTSGYWTLFGALRAEDPIRALTYLTRSACRECLLPKPAELAATG
jgi:hypothetical protein